MTRIDPLQEGPDVIRLPHPSGLRCVSVALPFGISRSVSATERRPHRWISENMVIVGDEKAVIEALARKLTVEIMGVVSIHTPPLSGGRERDVDRAVSSNSFNPRFLA